MQRREIGLNLGHDVRDIEAPNTVVQPGLVGGEGGKIGLSRAADRRDRDNVSAASASSAARSTWILAAVSATANPPTALLSKA